MPTLVGMTYPESQPPTPLPARPADRTFGAAGPDGSAANAANGYNRRNGLMVR